MPHVVIEGVPAVGKSEVLELLARFYPQSARVFPELVKEITVRERLDLFRERDRLTRALAAELPARARRISAASAEGQICIEESHLGVHHAYAIALGDAAFVRQSADLERLAHRPDRYIRLELPVERSVERQRARGTPAFDVDAPTLHRMLDALHRWHAERSSSVVSIDADRPAHRVLADVERALGLVYASSSLGGPSTETFDLLLLLGRPASGKSELIDFLTGCPADRRAARYHIGPFEVVDDFPLLWQTFLEDDAWERVGRRRAHSVPADGNYAVTDNAVWGYLIERINQTVRSRLAENRPPGSTVLIEFSRGGPSGYADALRRIDPDLLRRAAVFYLSVSFEESWRRNVARYDAARRDGILTHSVPREEMERTYRVDDWSRIAGQPIGILDVGGLRVPYATLVNEPESTDPDILDARYRSALGPLYSQWRTLAASDQPPSSSLKTRRKFL